MARLFDDASNEYLQRTGAIIAAAPFAVSAWFNSDDDAPPDATQSLFVLHDKDSDLELFGLQLYDRNVISYAYCSTGGNYAATSTDWTENTWHHACGIWATTTDRRAFLDAGGKGTNATASTPVNLDVTVIGQETRPAASQNSMSGMIAEVAVWDLSNWPGATGILKADGFERIIPCLAKGFSPLCYPLGLIAYWPLIRGLNDRVGGYNLTASGTTVSAHPRIILSQGVL